MKQNFKLPEQIRKVVANEHLCRVYLQALLDRGVRISVDPEQLNHEQMIAVVERIYFKLSVQEMH